MYSNKGFLFHVVDNNTGARATPCLESRTKLSAIDLACKALGFDQNKKGSAIDFFKRYTIVED